MTQPPEQPDIAVGITSAPRPNPTLIDTVESLTIAGITPTIFAEPNTDLSGLPEWASTVQRPVKLGAWYNFVSMCETLLEQGTEYVFTFQDDIGLSPIALEMFRRFPWPTDCGALSFYTPAHYYPWEADNPKWRRVVSNSFWGALGLVFKSDDLRRMLNTPAAKKWKGCKPRTGKTTRAQRLGGEHVGNVDYIMGVLIRDELKGNVYTHLPSLGQHIATHSAMGHGGNTRNRRAGSVITSIPNDDPQFGRTILSGTARANVLGKGYWMRRRDYKYYKVATRFVNDLDPKRRGGTLLDVGGGASMGCRYLQGVSQFDRTCLELTDKGERIDGVTSVFGDFAEFDPAQHNQGKYDVVLCLQMLEHVDDPETFAEKLFALAKKQVVISIPYKWDDKKTGEHHHHQLTGHDLFDWTGREPTSEKVITERHNIKRFVAEYIL